LLPAIALVPFSVMIAGIGESLLLIPSWAAFWPLLAGCREAGVGSARGQSSSGVGRFRRLLLRPNLKEAGWAALNAVVSTELLFAAVTPRIRGPGWLLFETFYDLEVTMLLGGVVLLLLIAMPFAASKTSPSQ
jgi:hypothetical protein